MCYGEHLANMAEFQYAILLEPDEGVIRVIVPAFPEIATFGDNEPHALVMARDAISLSIEYRRATGLEIPPSDADLARLARVVITTPAA